MHFQNTVCRKLEIWFTESEKYESLGQDRVWLVTSSRLEGDLYKLKLLNWLDLEAKPCQRLGDHLNSLSSTSSSYCANCGRKEGRIRYNSYLFCSVCPFHILTTVHPINFTLGGCIAEDPSDINVKLGAIQTCGGSVGSVTAQHKPHRQYCW